MNFKNELTFLLDISNTLANTNDVSNLLQDLKKIFQEYFSINNFQIFIKDESTSTLRDFVKSWIVIEKNLQQELVSNIFNKLKTTTEKDFILNNKFYNYTSNLTQDIEQEKNLMYFPIFNEKKLVGVIEINFDKINESAKTKEFLTALRIAISQINTVIINKILNRHLCANIKFQQIMKSIAKLIENQFELEYILPIIGELIDSFVDNYRVNL